MGPKPERLEPAFTEKVWGATALEPWFPSSNRKIGEVWFPAEDILVKFLFTSERLSIQVHPDDRKARAAGLPNGKTEMWHVLRADPGATLGLGFTEPIAPSRLRTASLSGEIERLIDWKTVAAGETYFVPAGTVHAIGPGLVLVEIQQNSDTTYRLYDYGRPRELHLEDAVNAADPQPHPGPAAPEPIDGGWRLIACEHFVTDLLLLDAPTEYHAPGHRYDLLVITEGHGLIAGQPFQPGHLWRVSDQVDPFPIEPHGPVRILRAFPPPAT